MGEGKGESYTFANGLTINHMKTRKEKSVDGRYAIGVLTDPSDEAVDIDEKTWSAALDATISNWKIDPARSSPNEPKIPTGVHIRKIKGLGSEGILPNNRGLLILYPLDPSHEAVGSDLFEGSKIPIIGFAISFPSTVSSEGGVKVEYQVNQRFWEEFGEAD